MQQQSNRPCPFNRGSPPRPSFCQKFRYLRKLAFLIDSLIRGSNFSDWQLRCSQLKVILVMPLGNCNRLNGLVRRRLVNLQPVEGNSCHATWQLQQIERSCSAKACEPDVEKGPQLIIGSDGKLGCSALYNHVPGLLRQNQDTFCRLLFFFFRVRQHKNCSLSCLLRAAVCSSCCHEHLQAFVCFCSEHSSTALLVTRNPLQLFKAVASLPSASSYHSAFPSTSMLHDPSILSAQKCCHRETAQLLQVSLQTQTPPCTSGTEDSAHLPACCSWEDLGLHPAPSLHRFFLPISLQVDLASAASGLLHVCSML